MVNTNHKELTFQEIISAVKKVSDITSKIRYVVYDHPSTYQNHDALAIAALMNNRNNYGPMEMAMMNGGGMNGQWNNPFAYLIWLMFAGRFFGNGDTFGGQGQQNVEMQNQLQAIRGQLQDNQNSNCIIDAIKGNAAAINQLAQNLNCDFNALQQCCCDVKNGINQLSGQVGFSAERVINAVQMGDCNVIQALKDCCCNTQKEILQMSGDIKLQNCQQTYELRNGQRDLGQAITQGFAASSFETQKQTCDIISAITASQQKTADLLNNHWSNEQAREIQDLKFQLSQERQNNYIAGVVRNVNNNCGCGCGTGVGY